MDTIQINFDALKKNSWSDQETSNVKRMIDFIQNLMNNHDFDYVLESFGNDQYKQHSRSIPEGMNALVAYVKTFAKRYPEYSYDVKHIYADGDFVTFHSHVTTKKKHRGDDKKGLNIIDTWKLDNGDIIEHWDAIQPMDAFMRFYIFLIGGKVLNSNGVY